MDYTARYGLAFNPFLKNAKEVIVETGEYQEARFRLDYLLSTKGFGYEPVLRAGGRQP